MGYTGPDMFHFLQGAFFFEPNIRLSFEVFVKWVQLEISCQNYEFAAEVLIKPYISQSTKFKDVTSKDPAASD